MNFLHIIDQLSAVDSDALDRLDTRRSVFNSLTTVAKRTAMVSAPALIAAYFSKAYAGTSAGDPKDVFAYALTLELLEEDFYKKMIASQYFSGASTAAQGAINQIKKHESAHVLLLQKVLDAIGGTKPTNVTFKSTTFNSLPSFAAQLGVAQLLEDTGVRAYKGRAGDLLGLADVNVPNVGTINPLQSALQIHSVEARHAAHIRTMRMQSSWINGNGDLDGEAPYKGAIPESTTTQSDVNLIAANSITPNTTYSAKDAQASFDEILSPTEVLAIAMPFIGA